MIPSGERAKKVEESKEEERDKEQGAWRNWQQQGLQEKGDSLV